MALDSLAEIAVGLAQHDGRLTRLEEKAEQDREKDRLLADLRVEIATLKEQFKGAMDKFAGQFKWLWGLMVAIFLALMGNILVNYRGVP